MKIVYFLKNGQANKVDKESRDLLKSQGHKVVFSNGSALKGFQDSCDAVYLSSEFKHIEDWALDNKIKVMKHEKPKPKPEKKKKPTE